MGLYKSSKSNIFIIKRSRMAKLALLLIKFMIYGIVQFLLYEYLEDSPNYVYIPNISY